MFDDINGNSVAELMEDLSENNRNEIASNLVQYSQVLREIDLSLCSKSTTKENEATYGKT